MSPQAEPGVGRGVDYTTVTERSHPPSTRMARMAVKPLLSSTGMGGPPEPFYGDRFDDGGVEAGLKDGVRVAGAPPDGGTTEDDGRWHIILWVMVQGFGTVMILVWRSELLVVKKAVGSAAWSTMLLVCKGRQHPPARLVVVKIIVANTKAGVFVTMASFDQADIIRLLASSTLQDVTTK